MSVGNVIDGCFSRSRFMADSERACGSPPLNQSPSTEDLRRTPVLRSSLDPLDSWRLAVGCRRDPETSGGCREGSRGCRGVPSFDYMLRAALVVTYFFLGENRHAHPNDSFFGFIVTRQTAMPIQIVPRFCARGYSRFKKLLYRCQNPSR